MIGSLQGQGGTPPAASLQGPGGTQPRPAQEGYKPLSPRQEKVLARVNERINWTAREPARWALERQIFQNVAFFCGIQWIEYDETSRRFSRWNAPSWFPTPVTNYFKPRVNLMSAALLRPKPQGRVQPKSNEAKDREAAKVGETFIPHIYDVTHEEELRQDAAQIAALSGWVIAKDYFDPRAGKLLRIPRMHIEEQPLMEPAAVCPACGLQVDAQHIGLPCAGCGAGLEPGERQRTGLDGTPLTDPTNMPDLDEAGQPQVDEMPEGELVSRVRMPFNFYWDPKAVRLREARWCGEAIYVDLDWIDEHFPELGPFVAAEAGIDGASFYEASLLALVGPSIQGSAHYGGVGMLQNGAVLRWYEEKPSREYPRGICAVVANGVVLYDGDLPIQDENGNVTGDFSYTEFRYDVVPGRMAGSTPAEDMVVCQRRVNGIDSQIILNRKTLLSPWILAPKGSGLNPGQVAMRPGAVVLYNTIGVPNAPQVVQGTALPAQIYEERQQAITAMDELSRDAASAAQTQIPPGMRSGISMYFLKEQTDELGLPRLERLSRWVAERDRKRLLLAQQHYREPRAIRILGQGTEYQIRYWQGADLAGNVDVKVDPGSLIPRSKSIKTQVAFDAIEKGLIDPTDPIQRQRLIEELDLREFDTEIGPDFRRAQKENAQMDDGQMKAINPFDNHEIHGQQHVARIKEPSFDALPPEAKRAHMRHMQAHQQAVQQAQDAQQQQEQQMAREQAQVEADTRAAAHGQVAPTITGQAEAMPPEGDPMESEMPPGGGSGPDLANLPADQAS